MPGAILMPLSELAEIVDELSGRRPAADHLQERRPQHASLPRPRAAWPRRHERRRRHHGVGRVGPRGHDRDAGWLTRSGAELVDDAGHLGEVVEELRAAERYAHRHRVPPGAHVLRPARPGADRVGRAGSSLIDPLAVDLTPLAEVFAGPRAGGHARRPPGPRGAGALAAAPSPATSSTRSSPPGSSATPARRSPRPARAGARRPLSRRPTA